MKHISRRRLIHTGCTIAGATLVPHFMDVAAAHVHRGSPPPPAITGFSQRSVLNINDFSFGTNDYAMIDHIKPSVGVFPTGAGGGYTSGTTWPAALDANGWPNQAAANGQDFSVSFTIPDPANFPGPYRLIWKGNGQINMHLFNNTGGTPTAANLVNCTLGGGNTFVYVSSGGASTASIDLTFTSTSPSGPVLGSLDISGTGTSGFFINSISLIRVADATDFAAGKIWRTGWKQPIVNLCPSAIRFMNMLGGNANRNCRFENRTLPSNATYYGSAEAGAQWTTSPVYPIASGTNQYTVGTAVPTTSNPKTTPASMVHGELATALFPNGFTRTSNGTAIPVTNISNANPGVVTSSVTIGLANLTWAAGVATGNIFENARFVAGDVVQFVIAGATQTGYNGTFTCTFTDAQHFTYTLVSNPGASPATGSPTYQGHGYNTNDQIIHLISADQLIGIFNSTDTITSINPGTSGLHAGMFITSPGIPANTTILNVLSGTSLQLSQPTTLTGSNVHFISRSMNNLHQFPTKITVTGPTTYTIANLAGTNIDTTSIGTFFNQGGGSVSCQYVTLQVGSGNDRVAYPMLFSDGNTPASYFGNYLSANNYKTWYFDKQIFGQTDGAGNPVLGAWMWTTSPGVQYVGHSGDMPIEVCIALVNELNAMSPAQTIGMWMNIPAWGMCSIDPDYTSASNWGINSADVVLNQNSIVRASGYSALGYSGTTKLYTPQLIIEYSNETWNSSEVKAWLETRGVQRWPTTVGQNSYQDMQDLRATCLVRDIKAASIPNIASAKFMIGMWGSVGISTSGGANNDFGGNYAKVFGGSNVTVPNQVGDWYSSDTTVVSGSWGTPISNMDGVCPATYFDPPDAYYDVTTGTGTFTDDSAMFNGTNNTSNGGGNYTGAANPTQACVNFVAKVVDAGNTGGGESVFKYQNVVMPNFAAVIPAGKVVCNYEGGTDWAAELNTNQTLAGFRISTTAQLAFVIGVINSSQWATAQVNFMNAVNAISKCFMPSIYTWIGAQDGSGNKAQRWSYCAPDTYATISGTPTEGAALTVNSPVWIAMGTRNQALP